MSTKITLKYFGFDGEGATVKEAKADAGRKIESLQDGYWTPVVRSWRDNTVIIYRTLHGWEYAFLRDGALSGGTCSWNADQQDTVKAAERHVADIGWTFTDPLDTFPAWFTDVHAQREIIGGRQWQMGYRQLKAQGLEDMQIRLILGGMEKAPEGVVLWPLPIPKKGAQAA